MFLNICLFVLVVLYLLGSWRAIELFKNTVDVEKIAKDLGVDYKIKNKAISYIICFVFSWLAYSALRSLKWTTQKKKRT